MVNIDATDSATDKLGLSNPLAARVDQPQPAVQAGGEAEAKTASGSSPASEATNPEPSQPTSAAPPQKPSRIWRSDGPYYPSPDRDGNHWKKVCEKADQFDKEFCAGWSSEIDALLTFAGLFSAVVTAFTVESYKFLQPDPQDTTNRILLNVSAQLAGRNATELPSGFTPSPSSLRINALWFLSLTFSLTAGLVGILCKQWLRHYQQDISKPPREALAFRQFRYDAFLRCRVMDILNSLPILLGLGLVLFFIGLIDFLQGLDVKVSIPVTTLIGIGFAFLLVTTSAPAFQYSPQSLAILHLVTWLFPLSDDLKFPNWTSLELMFLSDFSVLWTYSKRALTWLDETYSHSLDMACQICLCLQDVQNDLMVEATSEDVLQELGARGSSAAVIRSLLNTTRLRGVKSIRASSGVRRDVVAMKYLRTLTTQLNCHFALLEHSIRILNCSSRQVSSFEPLQDICRNIFYQAGDYPAAQVQEVKWQIAILFWNLLSEGRWTDSAKIPQELRKVFWNISEFTEEDLTFIFSVLCTWVNQHPQDEDLPSHCWAALTSGLEPHELDDVLRLCPPAHDLMVFLDSWFRMGDGIGWMACNLDFRMVGLGGAHLTSFFGALYAWIERNPQNTQSFIDCRESLESIDSRILRQMREFQPFRDFEAFLQAQIAPVGGDNGGEQSSAHDS